MRMELSSRFPLRPARVHEACGAGATGFAAIMALKYADIMETIGQRLGARCVYRPKASPSAR